MDNEVPILVDKKRAAKLLGVSTRTIDNLIRRGELRRRKIGRRTLLAYSQLLQFSRTTNHATK